MRAEDSRAPRSARLRSPTLAWPRRAGRAALATEGSLAAGAAPCMHREGKGAQLSRVQQATAALAQGGCRELRQRRRMNRMLAAEAAGAGAEKAMPLACWCCEARSGPSSQPSNDASASSVGALAGGGSVAAARRGVAEPVDRPRRDLPMAPPRAVLVEPRGRRRSARLAWRGRSLEVRGDWAVSGGWRRAGADGFNLHENRGSKRFRRTRPTGNPQAQNWARGCSRAHAHPQRQRN